MHQPPRPSAYAVAKKPHSVEESLAKEQTTAVARLLLTEETAVARKQKAVEGSLAKEQSTLVARLQTSDESAVAGKPKAVEDTSARDHSATLAHLSVDTNDAFSGDSNLDGFAKLAQHNFKKGRKKGSIGCSKRTPTARHPPSDRGESRATKYAGVPLEPDGCGP